VVDDALIREAAIRSLTETDLVKLAENGDASAVKVILDELQTKLV